MDYIYELSPSLVQPYVVIHTQDRQQISFHVNECITIILFFASPKVSVCVHAIMLRQHCMCILSRLAKP